MTTETYELHPALAELIERGRGFTESRSITVATEGNSILWSRGGYNLDWRAERQTLPGGAVPLAMRNEEGEIVAFCGQEFVEEEARAFLVVAGAGPAVVFEIER